MTQQAPLIETNEPVKIGSVFPYVIGFVLSLLLTLSSYFLVTYQWLRGWNLIGTIALLGVIQMIVQLFFFLHIGEEKKPRWNLLSFLFMALVVVILVCGSLWIMYHLNTRVMPTGQMM